MGTEIVTGPVAGVDCPNAMCVVADRSEFASTVWSNWLPGVRNVSSVVLDGRPCA